MAAGRRAIAIVAGVLAGFGASTVVAQTPGTDAAGAVFEATQARLRDAQTLTSLSAEGALLYQRERIRLGGYQYCSQAVALAERGELRQRRPADESSTRSAQRARPFRAATDQAR